MTIENYISSLKSYKGFAGDIVCHKTLAARPADFSGPPQSLGFINDMAAILSRLGIDRLYSHQSQAIAHILKGKHTVVATPTASGKSLIYNLPVMDSLMSDPNARAMYLFPLKALARDQMDTVNALLETVHDPLAGRPPLRAGVYDGDISAYQKSKVRRNPPHILLTNPEMLHLAMLAHHHLWADFFSSLKYVVVDEVHTYRGVMGSNMAWVFRRLLRICSRLRCKAGLYLLLGHHCQSGPAGIAGLTGLEVAVVDSQGAARGRKDVLMMRGLEGAAQTAITLIHAAVHRGLRTIVYTQSRKITELIAVWVFPAGQILCRQNFRLPGRIPARGAAGDRAANWPPESFWPWSPHRPWNWALISGIWICASWWGIPAPLCPPGSGPAG